MSATLKVNVQVSSFKNLVFGISMIRRFYQYNSDALLHKVEWFIPANGGFYDRSFNPYLFMPFFQNAASFFLNLYLTSPSCNP